MTFEGIEGEDGFSIMSHGTNDDTQGLLIDSIKIHDWVATCVPKGTSLDLDLNVATRKAQLEENEPGRTDVKVGTDAVAYFTDGNDIGGFDFAAASFAVRSGVTR